MSGKLEELEEKGTGLATKLRSLCNASGEEKSKALEDSAKLGKIYLEKANRGTGVEQNCSSELEELERKEKSRATKLRSLCMPSGEERTRTLKVSASILMELGVIYLEKAKLETSIDQKMSFIRSAVLLHGAIVRFQIVKNTEKIHNARKICNEMSRNALKFAGSRNQTDLTKISAKFFQRVCEKRKEIQKVLGTDLRRGGENDPDFEAKQRVPDKLKLLQSLESISIVDIERVFSPNRENKEKRVADKMREVNKDVTDFYKGILDDIATECLKLLPSPPCKFSIVGLGSLAREEVTLYSDFEHIILLEDGIEKKESYQSVLEYFRWFSVIFQIIVIGFGETIIPSVAVKSLNDFYSGDSHSIWYYDNFTPNGISFDGMLPHACKIPLGRQEKTKKRTHIVELIKTPSEMANYLTQKEQLKNGYYLAEVLRQTCLVYGDTGIYSSFLEERNRILGKDRTEVHQMYTKMILKNGNLDVREKYSSCLSVPIFDSKTVYYRPFATHLGVIARIHKIEDGPTFQIIDNLRERSLLGPYTYNKLRYAFAVVCEIRMKLYHRFNQQRHETQVEELEMMIGEETMQNCAEIITEIRQLTNSLATAKVDKPKNVRRLGSPSTLADMEKTFTTLDTPSTMLKLRNQELNKEAIRRTEKICRQTKDHDMQTYLEVILFRCYRNAAVKEEPQSRLILEYINKAELLYLKLQKNGYSLAADTDYQMASLYLILCNQYPVNRYFECVAAFEKYFYKHFKAAEHEKDDQLFKMACLQYYNAVNRLNLSPTEKDKKLQTVLWDKSDIVQCQLSKRMHFGQRSIQNGCADENVRREFRSLSTDVEKYRKKILIPRHFHITIAAIQVGMWWLKDAVDTLSSISHRITRECDEHDFGITESLKLLCLCRLHGNKVARCLPTTNENEDETLSQYLAKILWRNIHIPENKATATVVFTWVLHLKTRGRLQDIFLAHREMKDSKKKYEKAKRLTQMFVVNSIKHTRINATREVSFALLLLAKSL